MDFQADTRSARGAGNNAAARPNALDVDLMLFFHAVAVALSFTRAAQHLGIDQSWLSHKIRQFEAAIGAKLFVRSTRSVELTAAGRALLDPARRLAEVAEQAREATRLLQTAKAGVLRVGALPFSFQDTQRTALLDDYMARQSDVQLLITNGTTPALIESLRAGRIDIAFVSAPIDLEDFDSILLRENIYCLLVPEAHPLAMHESPAPADLAGHRIAIPSQRYSPAAYELVYRPVVESGIIAVPTPEFECAVAHACALDLPVVCTQHAAERALVPGLTIRPLDFVPRCGKYAIRMRDCRTGPQEALWNDIAASIPAGPRLH